jgi:N-methylhydantoinase A
MSARRAFFREHGGFVEVPVHQRSELRPAQTVTGPALIEEPTTTIVVAPGWSAHPDDAGNVLMRAGKG